MTADDLIAARLAGGHSQGNAALICGVGKRTYWQWENGKPPKPLVLEAAIRRLRESPKHEAKATDRPLRDPRGS